MRIQMTCLMSVAFLSQFLVARLVKGEDISPNSPVETRDRQAAVLAREHAASAGPLSLQSKYGTTNDHTTEALIEFTKQLMRSRPAAATREDFASHFKMVASTMLVVTENVLRTKELDDKSALEALKIRFEALNIREQLGDINAEIEVIELAERYRRDGRVKLQLIAKEKLFLAGVRNIHKFDTQTQNQMIELAADCIRGEGRLEQRNVRTSVALGSLIEKCGNDALAAKAYETFAGVFANQGDLSLIHSSAKLKGIARRLRLLGGPIDIKGRLLNGTDFDLVSLTGKVVLVMFWSTSSRQSMSELRNVEMNYAGFHKKGFEVIGVCLDRDKVTLEKVLSQRKIAWGNLFSEDEGATGWEHPLAHKYGVISIPLGILVNRDGKVVNRNLHGEQLGKALSELLGQPDDEEVKLFLAEQRRREEIDRKPRTRSNN